MSNLTLTIDDDLLRKARMRALAENTSVNAVVRAYLERYVQQRENAQRIIASLQNIYEQSRPSSGGRRWTREEIYDRDGQRREEAAEREREVSCRDDSKPPE